MKRAGRWHTAGIAMVMMLSMGGCGMAEESADSGAEVTLRTQLQKGADTFEISFRAPEEVLPYIEVTPFTQDVSGAGLTLVSEEEQGSLGYLVLYGEEAYDRMKQEDVPLEEELLRDKEEGVVLAYGGTQDAVFEQDTTEAKLVQVFQKEIENIKSSFQMEKVSTLPQEPNLETVLQLGERRYALSLAVPENLAEYMDFGALCRDDAAVTVRMEHFGQEGNVGLFVIYDAAEYDKLKEESLPLETELFRLEEEGIVLAFSGIQDSVFEPGTEEARMVLQYQEALEEILDTAKLERTT
ncbi:hypothetical protein H9X85_03615 [Anaerotignum lactatifermentans]|uniref:DUF4825 domain-containing protein n=1 Tax=Anaerotignum lactatifermentans TaxID=160404 RepID=A0ABS2G6G0_9FIRM|nr:hypothetical protein [Anaerotignum lactatifermentans]MBM6828719.1 hypothetical protein [Anaerotignum lactatifermentans]MBM6877046.1 hypothetical protein [Anaerotignum lactatifermentans]MBM6950301.1 hypothetical protein [Anaerotignum lactatifermentans]